MNEIYSNKIKELSNFIEIIKLILKLNVRYMHFLVFLERHWDSNQSISS